jgi:hypothetical protein
MTDKKDNKPNLKLLDGGKSNQDKTKKTTAVGVELTAKQLGFCKDIVGMGGKKGMTLVDAYRNNYNVSKDIKGNSLRAMSSKLRADVNITLTINKLLEHKEQLSRANMAKRSDVILDKIEKMADDVNVADQVRLRGLELLGKHHGLFTDVIKVDDAREKTSDEIQDELVTRLNSLLNK